MGSSPDLTFFRKKPLVSTVCRAGGFLFGEQRGGGGHDIG